MKALDIAYEGTDWLAIGLGVTGRRDPILLLANWDCVIAIRCPNKRVHELWVTRIGTVEQQGPMSEHMSV